MSITILKKLSSKGISLMSAIKKHFLKSLSIIISSSSLLSNFIILDFTISILYISNLSRIKNQEFAPCLILKFIILIYFLSLNGNLKKFLSMNLTNFSLGYLPHDLEDWICFHWCSLELVTFYHLFIQFYFNYFIMFIILIKIF